MKKVIYLILTLIIIQMIFSCSTTKNLNNQIDNNDLMKEKLAFELCAIYGSDQSIRDKKLKGKKIKIGLLLKNMDSINFDKYVTFVKKNGYPNKNLLGEFYKNECVGGTSGVILLHNAFRLVENAEYYNLFLNEVKIGNMPNKAFAMVIDKYYWAKSHGKEVFYGSGFGKPCSKDKFKVNKERLKIGLKPLKDNEFKICD